MRLWECLEYVMGFGLYTVRNVESQQEFKQEFTFLAGMFWWLCGGSWLGRSKTRRREIIEKALSKVQD